MMNITLKQTLWWHNHVYPIVNKDKYFDYWISYSAPKVICNKRIKSPNNLSDITFSVIENNGHINPSRFYIGFFEPTQRDIEVFSKVLKNFVGKDDTPKMIDNQFFIGFGLGIDHIAREKRVYVAYEKNPMVIGITYKWNGKLIEAKEYNKDNGIVSVRGQRGHRTQKDLHFESSQAKDFIKQLPLQDKFKNITNRVLNSGLFSLDTISTSDERGVALYFD